jgi:hypothetical protein
MNKQPVKSRANVKSAEPRQSRPQSADLPLGTLDDEKQRYQELKTDLERLAAERGALQKERRATAMKVHIHKDQAAQQRLSQIHTWLGVLESELTGLSEVLAVCEVRVESAMTAAGLQSRVEKAKVALDKTEEMRQLSEMIDLKLNEAATAIADLRTLTRDLLINFDLKSPTHEVVRVNLMRALKSSPIARLIPDIGVLSVHDRRTFAQLFDSYASVIAAHLKKIISGEITAPILSNGDASTAHPTTDDAEIALWVGRAKSALAFKQTEFPKKVWYSVIHKMVMAVKMTGETVETARTRLMQTDSRTRFLWDVMQMAPDLAETGDSRTPLPPATNLSFWVGEATVALNSGKTRHTKKSFRDAIKVIAARLMSEGESEEESHKRAMHTAEGKILAEAYEIAPPD